MAKSRYLRILLTGAAFALASLSLSAAGPGKIEAENYSVMAGVATEGCSDTGGGLDVGWIDKGDYMVYPISIPTTGAYTIQYRVASPNGSVSLSADLNAGTTVLGTVNVPNTGGWQNWQTVTQTVTLNAGNYNFGINAGTGGFNLNWFSIDSVATGTKVEAENYSAMAGIITETCSEGGKSVGAVDQGDWMVYPISISTAGTYTVQYRVASIYSGKTLSADLNAGATQLGSVAIPNTGGWQNWTTVSQTVNLPAGSYNFGINGGTGGWNLNWFTLTYSGNGGGGGGGTTGSLIPLAAGKQMTFQFQNNTGGKYADSQIYVLMIARNSAGKFCWLDKNGNLNPCVAGQNASSYTIKMSDFTGFQFPTFLDSGRLYISLGSPLNININSDINGNVGIAFPNIENSADPNINIYFEWVEFAVLNNQIWCNTTQVDQFGFPMTMELFQSSGSSNTSVGKVGVSESRAAIWSSYASSVPNEFKGLAGTYRILAPLHGSFRAGQANGNYFDGYINSIWSKYASTGLVITVPQGTFTGRVLSDNRMMFTRPGDSAGYYINKPTSEAVWGGLGALATGNTIELVLEAQVCAAFHRHVMDNAANFNNPATYYAAGPADYFSKFWHDHSINRRAYGFCYDDVNDQSSTMTCGSPRGIILSIGF